METLDFWVLVLGGMVLSFGFASALLGTGRQRELARRAAQRSRERELKQRGA